MFLEKLKPNSSGQRWVLRYAKSCFQTKFSIYHKFIKKSGYGRNNSGRITTRHRQSTSYNRFFKLLNTSFFSNTLIVLSYSCVYRKRIPVMELVDRFGNIYINRLVSGIAYGDYIYMFPKVLYWELYDYFGTKMPIIQLITGVVFCELRRLNNYAKMATSCGSYCNLVYIDDQTKLSKITMPSGSSKILSVMTICTVGRVGYEKQLNTNFGKAGIKRRLGIRPSVRGVAMNPVDHPHGGRTKTNSPEKSPWGWITKYNR